MKTLLVIAKQPSLSAALQDVLDPARYRVLPRGEVWEAEHLLRQGLVDVCVLDSELTSVEPIRRVEELRRWASNCPILIYSGVQQREWQEEAYLQGVAHVLAKPVRGRLINTLLERLLFAPPPVIQPVYTPPPMLDVRPPGLIQNLRPTLEVLRDISSILRHSLCSEALLQEFLLRLREIIGVNRAAVFLRTPPAALGMTTVGTEDRRFHSACALGIASNLLDHFALSLDAGIGGYLIRTGRILKSQSEIASRDLEILKEFEVLGCQIAIPILDRESVIGLAVFDGRLTGEPFANEELSLIFHLLEQLGMAVKNSWLHRQLSASHTMMTDILGQFGSGCVLVGRNLDILHANRMARSLFSQKGGEAATIEFWELPQVLGGKIHEVLKGGQELPPFKYRPPQNQDMVFQVKITPFFQRGSTTVNAVLLLIEDFTQNERSQELEIESSNLRLVKSMAAHLAHEIGNSLVALSTHHQLLPEQIDDPEFRSSLQAVMRDSVKRISRLSNQMLFLARDTVERADAIPVTQLIDEAFSEAQACFLDKRASLRLEEGAAGLVVLGDHAALRHALAELLLNSFQANPAEPQARLCFEVGRASRLDNHGNGNGNCDAEGKVWLRIVVHDTGPGFTAETLRKAQEPFFSTRKVGLGLGLTVARKIVETHRGKLKIGSGADQQAERSCSSDSPEHGVVSITLPLHQDQKNIYQ